MIAENYIKRPQMIHGDIVFRKSQKISTRVRSWKREHIRFKMSSHLLFSY